MGKPRTCATDTSEHPVWIAASRADFDSVIKDLRSNGERYRIYEREVWVDRMSVVVAVLVIYGKKVAK
jgi:hypothetical protein